MEKHLLFVYGTLKSGFWNHHYLEDSEYLGKAETYKEIDDLNGYPVDRVDLSAAGAWGWKSVDEELPYLVKAYTMTCYGGLF